MAEGDRTRLPILSWLRNILDTNKLHGVEWIDKEAQTFKVPWQFQGRDFDEKKSAIFKEYAILTGKISKTEDEDDYPSWKTNFRNALNKKIDLKKLRLVKKDKSKTNPHQVYQFLDVNQNQNSYSSDQRSLYDINSCLLSTDASQSTSTSEPSFVANPVSFCNVPKVVEDINQDQNFTDQNTFKDKNINKYLIKSTQNFNSGSVTSDNDEVFSPNNITTEPVVLNNKQSDDLMPNDLSKGIESGTSSKIATLEDQKGQMKEAGDNITWNDLPSDLSTLDTNSLIATGAPPMELGSLPSLDSLKTSLEIDSAAFIEVFYGQTRVQEYTLKKNSEGCRIFFPEDSSNFENTLIYEDLYGPANLEQVSLPPLENQHEPIEKKRLLIKKTLGNMGRGLIFRERGDTITIERLCKSSVFLYKGAGFSSSKIERKDKTEKVIFNFVEFSKEPHFNQLPVILVCGSDVPLEPKDNPLSLVLVHFKITHTKARMLRLTTEFPSLPSNLSSLDSIEKLREQFSNASIKND